MNMNQIILTICSLLFLIASPFSVLAQDGWQQLFNGENLDGWTQLNGEADYRVENNAIVGKAVPDTPNSFLTTDDDYGDFILEFDVYMDTQMNSGVQFRSQEYFFLSGRPGAWLPNGAGSFAAGMERRYL